MKNTSDSILKTEPAPHPAPDMDAASSINTIEVSQEQATPDLAKQKRTRAGHLGALTRKSNDILDLMVDNKNLTTVKNELKDYELKYEAFKQAHEDICTTTEIEEEIEKLDEYYRQKRLTIVDFIRSVNVWIRRAEIELSNDIDSSLERSSCHSGRSSVSAITRERAKIAELLTEQAMMHKRQEAQALELEIQLAKAQARKRAITESMQALEVADVKQRTSEISVLDVPPMSPQRSTPTNTAVHLVEELKQRNSVASSDEPTSTSQFSRQTSKTVPLQEQPRSASLGSEHLLAALTLPQPEVNNFSGSITEYRTFAMAFDARVASRVSAAGDKLYYLHQHLTGEPRDLIDGCLYMPVEEGYRKACELLEREYGDSYKLSGVYISKIREWSNIRPDDSIGLKHFAMYLKKCKLVMPCLADLNVLNHAPNLLCTVQKLPVYLQHKWRDLASRARIERQKIMQFDDLADFISSAAEACNDPVYGIFKTTTDSKGAPSKPHIATASASRYRVQTTSMATSAELVKCPLCEKQHDLESCTEFINKTIEQRRAFLIQKGLCFACFGYNHLSKGCRSKRQCNKCGRCHPTSLHIDGFQMRFMEGNLQPAFQEEPNATNTVVEEHSSSCGAIDVSMSVVMHAILPVKIFQAGKTVAVETYAFYDNGSNGCFITEELQEQLQAEGVLTTLQLRTMHGCSNSASLVIKDLVVTDLTGKNEVCLPKVYTRGEIPVSHNQIPKPEIIRKLQHLNHVAEHIPEYKPDLNIGILIGSNCAPALEPLEVVLGQGSEGGLYAVKLIHSWTIHGPIQGAKEGSEIAVHRVMVEEVKTFRELISPESILQMFDREFDEHVSHPDQHGLSQEDRKFLQIVEDGIQFSEGHYTIPLPFRERPVLPNNKAYAMKRLMYQKGKMLRNPQYYEHYKEFMFQLFEKDYAKEVQEDPSQLIEGSVWFLPHHGVYSPSKPNKIRVVFDCSANFMGTSLNMHLLHGPDLTSSIIGVLTRFREDTVAFMADIEGMFHQVRVPPEQRSFLRFLWWPGGCFQEEIKEYQMKVHLFGATSSPSVANYAFRKAGRESYNPDVTETIMKNFYVDDCLKCVDSTTRAITLIKGLCETCSKGGFHLTKFVSNDVGILQTIPTAEHSKNLQMADITTVDIHIEKALGVQWEIKSDKFGFCITIKDRPCTRRGILSVISSIFDPLGFLSPVILPAKRILQDLCKNKDLDWDDAIPDEQLEQWRNWITSLQGLQGIKVNQSFVESPCSQQKRTELHVFADGSTYGYGAVVYYRAIDSNDNVSLGFAFAKARLAPIKMKTIPKLELTAAMTAVRLAELIKYELSTPVTVQYYTDSTTVLNYLSNDSKRWPVFVANRVQIIRNHSDPSQWAYIPSESNPADDASCGLTVADLLTHSHWLSGPPFLRNVEISSTPSPQANLEAVVTMQVDAKEIKAQIGPVNYLMNYFSSWQRLKTAIAVYLKVRRILQDKVSLKSKPEHEQGSNAYGIDAHDIQEAQMQIFKWLHRTSFPKEMNQASLSIGDARSRAIPKSSPLWRLDPYLEDGILRVGGRLRRANLCSTAMNPVILPKRSTVTSLIIRETHINLGHAGRNHVLSELRQNY